MIRTIVISTAVFIAVALPAGDATVKPVYAHGLVPGDDDVFFRRYRGDDEVSDSDRGGGRDKDKGRGKDKETGSSGGGKGGGGKSSGSKSKSSGRPNPNDSDDRFGN